jgi:3-phytase
MEENMRHFHLAPQRKPRTKPFPYYLIFGIIIFMAAVPLRAQTIPVEITANARVNTGSVSGDADDPAIWIHPTNPALSLVIGTDKAGNFVYVWDMNGQELQRVSVSRTPNNGDVRYDMEVGGAPVDIFVVGAQSPSRLVVFKIDPNTRALSDITAASGAATPQVKEPYGVCLYRRASDGAMYAFVNSNGGVAGVLNQYQLLDDGAGRVKAVFVRSFGGEVNGKHSEGMVADDQLGYVYIAEEDCCVHKFYADPDMGNARLAVFAHADGIEPDREGLGIYGCADGTGYILLSSQGNKRVKVYRREGDAGNPHSHTLVTTIYTPNIGGTDGLDVTNRPAGPNFPFGFLAKHNSSAKNFGLIAWEDIAKTYLKICPDEVNCDVTANFSSNITTGCAPLTVSFTDQSSGPVTSWSWNFGDGNTSTLKNPLHTYTTSGMYTVQLTVTSATCSHTATTTAYIIASGVPTAAFAGAPTSGGLPLTVNFSDQSTGVPTAWWWDFGDGNTSTVKNPSHQYATAGTYTVTLTATNACGTDAESKSNYITVNDCTPGNVARGKLATASSSRSGYPPSYAVDGNTSTTWKSSSGGVQWLEIDLGAAYETDDAFIRWDGSNRAKDFSFQYWNMATSSWVTLFSQTNNGSSTSMFSFPLTCAQKFRVYMTKPNSSRYYIKEVEINGCGCTAAVPKTDVGQFMQPVETLPGEIELHPNFPNPFNPRTSISFTLPKETDVTLKVYNVAGEEVVTLVHERRGAGLHTAGFDAANLPSGLYFSVLQVGEVRQVQRLLFIK